tara:strand:- start:10310 stop:10870 length:561 start_codon:yes stop_codon:yes gene_type:complete
MISKILDNPWNQSLNPLINEARMQQEKNKEKLIKDEIQRLENILRKDKHYELTEEQRGELKEEIKNLEEILDIATDTNREFQILNELNKLKIREMYSNDYEAIKAEHKRLQQWNKEGDDWIKLLKDKTGYNEQTLPFKKVRGYLGRGKKSKKKHQKKRQTKKPKKKRQTKRPKKKRQTKRPKKKRH